MSRCVGGLVVYLITVADVFSLGWEVREMRGYGGEGCGSGRRSC